MNLARGVRITQGKPALLGAAGFCQFVNSLVLIYLTSLYGASDLDAFRYGVAWGCAGGSLCHMGKGQTSINCLTEVGR